MDRAQPEDSVTCIADRFDSPLSGLTSLATSFHCQSQPSPETESPQVLARAKCRFFRKSLLESGRMEQEISEKESNEKRARKTKKWKQESGRRIWE